MSREVHLGFEVGTGKPVSIPLRHMVVTGQTQEAGKTTTLEALIARANTPAIAFVTKRGERSFAKGQRLQPYFRERADWQFVASVLEASMRERLKFERAWIIRASKGARTLANVQTNVREAMKKASGLSADVYLTLDSYLDIVVPRIEKVKFAESIDLRPGLNVMDVSDRDSFPPELQSLVMRSVLEWVYEKADGAITIIPEAWEFMPQGRGSPVKLAAESLIRKGAGLHNYVWIDSQDIGGVDKQMLRSCPVWLLGVQREANEIKRTLENIPAGVAKPKPSDVATLEKGQFYACFGKNVIKTYVQPAWMTHPDASKVARGVLHVESLPSPAPQPQPTPEEPMSKAVENKLDILIDLMTKQAQGQPATVPEPTATTVASTAEIAAPPADQEALYQAFKARLMKEAPGLIKLLAARPEIEIEIKRETIRVDLSSARGMIAKLISEGFLEQTTGATDVHKEMARRWNYKGISARAYEQLDALTVLGFVTKEKGGYRAVPEMKINIVS